MDAIRAAFESQFGTEWSNPVVQPSGTAEEEEHSDEFAGFESEEEEESVDETIEDGPVVIKHTDTKSESHQPLMTKSQRRKFMTSGAPLDDTANTQQQKNTKEDGEDLKNDLALQRLIEESHILGERSKDQQFSGADISGAVDPLDHVGKTRLKVMEARLEKAGAKKSKQRMPQAMAVGIRDKRSERVQKTKKEAREAGIILAKDRHTRTKNRFRDKGLKINSVGKASEHGIHISQAEIERINGKSKPKGRKRR